MKISAHWLTSHHEPLQPAQQLQLGRPGGKNLRSQGHRLRSASRTREPLKMADVTAMPEATLSKLPSESPTMATKIATRFTWNRSQTWAHRLQGPLPILHEWQQQNPRAQEIQKHEMSHWHCITPSQSHAVKVILSHRAQANAQHSYRSFNISSTAEPYYLLATLVEGLGRLLC